VSLKQTPKSANQSSPLPDGWPLWRARLLKPGRKLKEYRWSSWPEYLKRPGKRWAWLRVDRLLGEWNVKQDNAAGGGSWSKPWSRARNWTGVRPMGTGKSCGGDGAGDRKDFGRNCWK
jgi:hypothetical protein